MLRRIRADERGGDRRTGEQPGEGDLRRLRAVLSGRGLERVEDAPPTLVEIALLDAVGAAALCDALDGRLARLLDATTRIGAELDSLADLVSFNVGIELVQLTIIALAFPALLFLRKAATTPVAARALTLGTVAATLAVAGAGLVWFGERSPLLT